MQEIKHRSGPTMKAANDGRGSQKPPADVLLAEPDDWHPMKDVPKDGTHVYLLEDDDKIPHDWFWYKTRQFRKPFWREVAWWKRCDGTSEVRALDPKGWRRVSEGLPK